MRTRVTLPNDFIVANLSGERIISPPDLSKTFKIVLQNNTFPTDDKPQSPENGAGFGDKIVIISLGTGALIYFLRQLSNRMGRRGGGGDIVFKNGKPVVVKRKKR